MERGIGINMIIHTKDKQRFNRKITRGIRREEWLISQIIAQPFLQLCQHFPIRLPRIAPGGIRYNMVGKYTLSGVRVTAPKGKSRTEGHVRNRSRSFTYHIYYISRLP